MVNICGLALGVAAFWVIALYVTDEWSYDRYNEKADRIFRVVQHGKWGNGGFDLAITSTPYAPALKAVPAHQRPATTGIAGRAHRLAAGLVCHE